jgi:hypothetical protein
LIHSFIPFSSVKRVFNTYLHYPCSKSDCPTNWCTAPAVYFLLFTNLFMVLMVFILPVICEVKNEDNNETGNRCVVEPFSILIFCHAFYWICHLVVDQYLKFHHRNGRLLGYLEFYIQTKNLRRSPFYIISAGNVILLVTDKVLYESCDAKPDCMAAINIELLRAIIVLECMTVAFMWTRYIVAVKKFKKENRRPDIFREEFRRRVLPAGNAEFRDQETNDEKLEVMVLQSELLIQLCPKIGEEPDILRQNLNGEARNLPRQTV